MNRCEKQFGPDLGPEYQCIKEKGHPENWHEDQFGNDWIAP